MKFHPNHTQINKNKNDYKKLDVNLRTTKYRSQDFADGPVNKTFNLLGSLENI